MKLKEYIKELQKIATKHGDDLELIYGEDEEGNSFNFVYFSPSIQYISKKLIDEGKFSIDPMQMSDTKTEEQDTAVVCIN